MEIISPWAYIPVYKFDIICLSETYLDSKTLPDDNNLDISGYKLVRSEHPSNSKLGEVWIYYKEVLPLRVINVNYLNEYIRFELNIGEKLFCFINLYRSPSQTQDEFDKFTNNLQLNISELIYEVLILHVLISILHPSLIWLWSQIVIIRLFSQNLI